ncbi:dynamin-related protein 4C-like protein [Tanacetum coccineum]
MCFVEQKKSQQHFTTISEAMPAFTDIIKVSQKSLYKIVVSREYVDYEDDTQMHCHTQVWDCIESVIARVLVLHAQNYPQLIRSVKKAAKNVTTIAKERFKGEVFEYLEINNMDGYTRDPSVISSWNKHKESRRVFHAMLYNRPVVDFFDVYVSIGHLNAYSAETIKEAIDIKAKMVALLEMVLKMFIDFAESHLHKMLHEMVEKEMETELLNELKSEDENKYTPLLLESPLMTTKRWKIKSRIELLKKLKKVVEDATDEISFHGY